MTPDDTLQKDPAEEAQDARAPHERDWAKPWQGPFLLALSRLPDVSGAARAAQVGRKTVYRYRDSDGDFAQAWDDALELAKDGIQRIAWTWATAGVPVKSRRTVTRTKTGLHPDPEKRKAGELVTIESVTETVETEAAERSATLMIFMLKANYPDKYRWIERVGIGGDAEASPVRLESVSELDRQIELLAAELRERGIGDPVPDEAERELG